MRKVCLLMIFSSLAIGNLWSQTTTWIQPDNWMPSKPSRYSVEGAKGSAYLFKVSLSAVIYMKSDRETNNVKVNLFNQDDMVVSKPKKGVEASSNIEENDILHFVITLPTGGNRTFVRINNAAFTNSSAQTDFYEALTENQAFTKSTYKEFKKAEKVGGYSSSPIRDEFVLMNQYYFKNKGEQKYQDFKLSKSPSAKCWVQRRQTLRA